MTGTSDPSGEARRAALARLTRVLHEARCAEMQADGVPCADAHGSCEACLKAAERAEQLADQIWGPGAPW